MKWVFYIVVCGLLASMAWVYARHQDPNPVQKHKLSVLMVYHPSQIKKYPYVFPAYESVLEEEGVPFERVTPSSLLAHSASAAVDLHPVVIFPDGVAQKLPEDIIYWVREYVENGGHAMAVFDPGTKDLSGYYLKEAVLDRLTGIAYSRYSELRDKAYDTAYLRFRDSEAAEFFEIPDGKLWSGLYMCGYAYQKLKYPVARVATWGTVSPSEIWATAEIGDDEHFPALVLRRMKSGSILYVNLPLGQLKAYGSDDLMMRSILRAYLFKVAKMPHLMSVPNGIGGLVINWHIDDNSEWFNIPDFIRRNYFRPSMPASFHITAGDFVDYPGDGMGFDACGKGREQVKMAAAYGHIGSHGGWGHNWFAANVLKGKFHAAEMEKYITRNSRCLSESSGYPVIEYSAPDGVHPQPILTRVLEKLGVVAYYYTGDSGSAPNRTFFDGKRVSESTIAFPVMPMKNVASIHEMYQNGVSNELFTDWLVGTANYAAKNHTVRLVYSHLYDLYDFPMYYAGLEHFLDAAETLQKDNRLQVRPMHVFAQFLNRMLKTHYSFNVHPDGLELRAANEQGLDGITAAIPRESFEKPESSLATIREEGDYYYVTFKSGLNEATMVLNSR